MSGEIVTVGRRKVRPIGGAVGQSFDLEGLRELGIVNDDGELVVEELRAKQTIRADGTIEIDLDLENVDPADREA